MTNTPGEKELKTDWDDLTESDSTKKIGHEQSLKAKNYSNVLSTDTAGIR